MLQDNIEFHSELQELYVSICAARNARKRQRSGEYRSGSVDSFVPDQDQTSCVTTGDSIHPIHIHCFLYNAFILSYNYFWLDNITGMRPASPGSNQNYTRQQVEEAQYSDTKEV